MFLHKIPIQIGGQLTLLEIMVSEGLGGYYSDGLNKQKITSWFLPDSLYISILISQTYYAKGQKPKR